MPVVPLPSERWTTEIGVWGRERSELICLMAESSQFLVFFFLQAEDGIRDDLVTGVQTCALPIFRDTRSSSICAARGAYRRRPRISDPRATAAGSAAPGQPAGAPGRRVGAQALRRAVPPCAPLVRWALRRSC